MNLILKSIMTTMTISLMLTLLSMLIWMKKLTYKEKMSPFECGFNPMSNKRLPFSLHFFLISILFLIFDIEIVIIMPMIMTAKLSSMKYWIMTTVMFTIIMISSIYFEWKKGLLNWSK